MSERKYFGTDGVRGRVGEYPITPEFAVKLQRLALESRGRAGAGSWFGCSGC